MKNSNGALLQIFSIGYVELVALGYIVNGTSMKLGQLL